MRFPLRQLSLTSVVRSALKDERRGFTGLNYRTCRWPLFEGHEPFYEKL